VAAAAAATFCVCSRILFGMYFPLNSAVHDGWKCYLILHIEDISFEYGNRTD
jgi:hypothetical protein